MFDRIARGFNTVLQWVGGKKTLSKEEIEKAGADLERALVSADVPLTVVRDFTRRVMEEAKNLRPVKGYSAGDVFISKVYTTLVNFLGGKKLKVGSGDIIMFVGLQGSGKTTTVAKVAYLVRNAKLIAGRRLRVGVVSLDNRRPAAREQLKILVEQAGAEFFECKKMDPVECAGELRKIKANRDWGVLLVDTAGRMNVDVDLMREISDVKSALSPTKTLMVVDAMMGRESLDVLDQFKYYVGFDGIVLTKVDSGARGGVAFAAKAAIGRDIYLMTTGEKLNDVELFIPERVASRLIGMGDVATLAEKLADEIDEKEEDESRKLVSKMLSGEMNLEDFERQLRMVRKMGALSKILRYLPGGLGLPRDVAERGEEEIERFLVILSSMTKREKKKPELLSNISRVRRIAKGSGTSENEVKRLLEKFEQGKQVAKLIARGDFPSRLRR